MATTEIFAAGGTDDTADWAVPGAPARANATVYVQGAWFGAKVLVEAVVDTDQVFEYKHYGVRFGDEVIVDDVNICAEILRFTIKGGTANTALQVIVSAPTVP